jgi:hypothetical protein
MINDCYLPGIRPGICTFYKPCSNWNLTDVIPFLRIAFCGSQKVIEKAALPDRVARISTFYGFAHNAFKRADPISKSHVCWNRDEKMQVVW